MTRPRGFLIALCAVFAVVVVARAARKDRGSLRRTWLFAGAVLDGRDPYVAGDPRDLHAPYPPSFGIVMSPLRLLPLTGARVAWALLQLAMLAVLVRLCLDWWRAAFPARAPPWWIPALALVLVFRYLWRDTAGGGGNLVFGTLVALACLRPGEPPGTDRRPWRGALLGIVLAAKPTPLLFLPLLWLRGRRRALGIAVAVAVALHLAPLPFLGAAGWSAAYARWIEGAWMYAAQADVFAQPALDFPEFTWMNQSLRCAVARFFGTVPAEHALDSPLFLQGLGLAPELVAWIHRSFAAALVSVTFAWLWSRRRDDAPPVELAGFAMVTCVTLLLSPVAWKSYHVQLYPAFFLLLALLATDASRRRLAVHLVIYFVACGLLSETLLGKSGKNVVQSLYLVTLGAVQVWLLSLATMQKAAATSGPD